MTRRLTALALACVVVTACGVPTDDEARQIPPEEIPFGLAETTTTVPTADTNPTVATDQVPAADVSVDVFFVRGKRLTPVVVEVGAPATPKSVIDALLTPPDVPRLRSVLGEGDIVNVEQRGNLAVVDLESTLLELPTSEQVLAVGQIVLSLTALTAIDAVSFTTAGEPATVPLPDGTAASEPVRAQQFAELLR